MDGQENSGMGEQPFGVPEGYFSFSAGRIANRIMWQQEHEAYPALLELKSLPLPFTTPEAYFDRVESRGELIPFPEIAPLRTVNPFSVPASYFENAERRMQQNAPRTAKVFTLRRNFTMMAAAAVFVISSGIIYYSRVLNVPEEDCGTIACVERNELVNSRHVEMMDESELYDAVNPDKLEDALGTEKPRGYNDSAEAAYDDEI